MEPRQLNDLEFLAELLAFFGVSRASQLLGWAMIWGLTGRDRDLTAFRLELQEKGLGRSAAYVALSDYKRFADHIRTLEGTPVETERVVERLGQLKLAA